MRHRVHAPPGTVFTQQDSDETVGNVREFPTGAVAAVVTGVELINGGRAADLTISIDYWPEEKA
jgi:hypothetical protein